MNPCLLIRFSALAALIMVTACKPSDAPEGKGVGAVVASLAGERFYDRQTFTIEYRVSGSATGTIVAHHRDWGKRNVEIQDTSTTFGAVTNVQRTRKVYDGGTVYSFDQTAGTMVSGPTPFYNDFVTASRSSSGVETGKAILRALGGIETSETAVIANEQCTYWEIAKLSSRSCITSWGGTLHATTRLGQITLERKATAVRIGDPGPDAAFSTNLP